MSASVTETINRAPDTIAEELSSKLNLQSPPPELPHWESPKPTEEELEWADILTVDLSLYETKRQELIDTITVALERDGFFYVTNHGISRETLQRQFDIGQHTFDGVSREEKEQHRAPIKEKGSFMGYKLQNYWEIKDGVRDRIEHYNFYQNHIDPITRHPKPLQPYVEEAKEFLADIRQKVLRRILNLIDGVLGLEEGYLFSLHQDSKGRTGDDLLRYMIYDPLTALESQKTNGVMLNGHTDFNSLSTLVSQPVTALQVLMPDNVWRYVKHKDGALVINIGDQLSFMSGGTLKGTMHRVVRPPEDQLHYRRLGVFHFAHFINGISLDLLPSKKVHEQGHVIFHNEVPTSDQWEATRVKNYGTAQFIKGEEYDIEEIAGIQLRHYH
ncbi:gibberellin 3-beta [Moniliophthora roreri]|nr:gibberellin 3-beta [Moniliophthora roreri]